MRSLHLLLGSVALCALVTACGGGSSSSPNTTPPTTAPTSPLVLAPTSLTFVAGGANAAQTVTVTETNYTGAFTESDTCGTFATVSTQSASGPSATYTVTPLAAGTCTITVHDANGQKGAVAVGITLTNGGVN
jgi:hypothetical protein